MARTPLGLGVSISQVGFNGRQSNGTRGSQLVKCAMTSATVACTDELPNTQLAFTPWLSLEGSCSAAAGLLFPLAMPGTLLGLLSHGWRRREPRRPTEPLSPSVPAHLVHVCKTSPELLVQSLPSLRIRNSQHITTVFIQFDSDI